MVGVTPEEVVFNGDKRVGVPDLSAHQVALLIRGCRKYVEVSTDLHAHQVLDAAGYLERVRPASETESVLDEALSAWCSARGYVPSFPYDTLESVWNFEDELVSVGEVSLRVLWVMRLSVDWVVSAELDKADGGAGLVSYESFAPLRSLHEAIVDALNRCGVRED